MSFLSAVPEDEAEGLVRDQYAAGRKALGYVPNYTKAFSARPEVYAAWNNLIGAIRSGMRLRRYELVTLAAAMALECRYCTLAHTAVLQKSVFSAEELRAILKDFRNAGLPADEVALMAFAQKVATRAAGVLESDVEELRSHGLSEQEIFDVIAASAARAFFSKCLDAVGAEPDEKYAELEPELLDLAPAPRRTAALAP